LKALSFDIHSLETLLSDCPVCAEQLTFRHSRGVQFCHRCGPSLDFRDCQMPLVEVEDVEGLRFVTDLIDPEHPRGPTISRHLHGDLQAEDRGHLFFLSVLAALALDVGANKTEEEERKRSLGSASVTPSSLARAGRALMNWPFGFAEIVSYLEQSAPPPLYGKNNYSAFSIMCRSAKTLSKSLLRSIDRLTLIARSEVIAKQNARGTNWWVTPRDRTMLESDFLSEALLLTRRSTEVKAMLKHSQLPLIVLFNCFLSGVIRCPDSDIDALIGCGGREAPDWSFACAKTDHNAKILIPIRRAVRTLNCISHDPWPQLLDAIWDGKLLLIRQGCEQPGINSLRVDNYAILKEHLNADFDMPATQHCRLNMAECMFYTNLNPQAVRNLILSGTESQNPTYSTVTEIFGQFVSIEEIVDRVAMTGRPRTKVAIRAEINRKNVGHHPASRSFRIRADVARVLGWTNV
jgi:hypothetical protein